MKYVLDSHCHSVSSGHAYSTITEYASEAAKKGLELIAVTDHAPAMPGAPDAIYFRNFKIVPERIFGVEIMCGVELSILDFNGKVDLDGSDLARLGKNGVVIASYHSVCLPPGSIAENTQGYINIMKNEHIHIIGHPGDPNFPADLELLAETAAKTGTVLEINNSSLSPKAGTRRGSDVFLKDLLKYGKRYETLIVCGSDAHFSTYAGTHGESYELIAEAEYPERLVLNSSAELFKRSLKIKGIKAKERR